MELRSCKDKVEEEGKAERAEAIITWNFAVLRLTKL